ncbi:DUF3426 domain-containing protein [Steroidobacter agaridevorans]|uniref:DUF3426 domain-containing protein n=1 Tax=Steroidobacter agaridevorans TaxID=2695856 RepID=UPI0013207C57|nr:DUF3426 domain-containing protein [Steroidobacter agaridevorans]GFE88204.1 hypothetical protein GCM10011488_31580 [Steroidobacter agaridevorans]
MLTQCPSCQTTFRVTSEILRVAHGQVRCGRCQTQFDALERLIEETDDGEIESGQFMRPPRAIPQPPPPPGQIEVEEPVEHEDITLEGRHIEISGVYEAIDESGQGQPQIREEVIEEWVEIDQDDATSDVDVDREDDSEPEVIDMREEYSSVAAEDADIEAAAAEMEAERAASQSGRWAQAQAQPQANFTNTRVRPPAGTRTRRNPRAISVDDTPAVDFDFPSRQQSTESVSSLWKILAAPLVLLLLVQVVHHYRAALAKHPQIGAPLQSIYGALGLTLRPDWNLHAYEVRQWGVVADPAQPGTLKVRASVKNLADFPQPYPLLKLVLEDRWGDQVRAREFDPSEYLDPTAAPDRMLAPAQQSNASIAIVDPGPDAEGFRFDVCLRGARGPVCAADVPGKL